MTLRYISDEDLAQLEFHGAGRCLDCGCITYGVDPAAELFPCDECGRYAVHGADKLRKLGYGGPPLPDGGFPHEDTQ